jgi:hypothetical protein
MWRYPSMVASPFAAIPAQSYFQQRQTFRGQQLAILRIYSDAACCEPTKLLAWASSGRPESWPLLVDLSNAA